MRYRMRYRMQYDIAWDKKNYRTCQESEWGGYAHVVQIITRHIIVHHYMPLQYPGGCKLA